MKIWFSYCWNFTSDSDSPVKVGINWYRHINTNPKFKSWRGLTVIVHFFKWTYTMNAVDDYDAYDKKINYKRDPDHLKKLGERLRAKKDKK